MTSEAKLRYLGSLIGVCAALSLIPTQGCGGGGGAKRASLDSSSDAAVDRSVDRPVDLPADRPAVTDAPVDRPAPIHDAPVDPSAPKPDRTTGAPDVPLDVRLDIPMDVPVDMTPPRTTVAVVTNRYDNVRNGANLSETILNVANVAGGAFGLIFSRPLDGQVYAQPLYLPGLVIGGATHNVVFVATEHDTVYAFDADDAAAGEPLWSVSLGTPMDTVTGSLSLPLVPVTVSCSDMFPKTGITSTPVIDPATGRMYVVTKNFEGGTYFQRLHALDILTGKDVPGSPVEIAGSVPGTAPDGDGTTVTFNPFHQLNRPGLLLTGGNVYVAFGSHCDDEPYHGWIFAYSASTLAKTGILCTTPNGGPSLLPGGPGSGMGGIWQSGMGLVADQNNNVFFVVGNGAFDPTNNGIQLGVSVARVQLMSSGFKLMDWFTAYNAQTLNDQDLDFTSAPVLLPDPKVIVMGGKDGYLNVIDPANMGRFNPTANQIIQQFPLGGHTHGGPVYWKGPAGPTIYVWSESTLLRSFTFNGNKLNTTAASTFAAFRPAHPGGILSLSANGSTAGTGILWATSVTASTAPDNDAWHNIVPGTLRAFDATDLTTPIWTSPSTGADALGNLAKFTAPVVVNGKVYIVSQGLPDGGTLLVYGLRP